MSGQELDASGVKILDGAVRVLGDFGFKRATVELVAKYAGVSHMTIYRRWPSKNDLLTTAAIGELTTLLDTAFGQACQSCPEFADRSLNAFTDTVWAVQNHPIAIRELNSESGEYSALLSSSSSTVMDVGVPLIAERLQLLDEETEDAPADLDAVADVFVRLAYSLVTVKRSGRPLASRAEVAAYASESFGPYLQGLQGPQSLPDEAVGEAAVVDLASRRAARERGQRPYLQIAAASLVGVLTLGAGLTAVLGGNIKIPFVSPANISRSGIPATPTNLPPGPAPEGSGSNSDPGVPGASAEGPAAPGSTAGPSAADPSALPAGSPAAVPPAGPSQPDVAVVGSNGGNAGGNAVVDNLPVLANPAPQPPRPTPGPQPPKPGPQPPNPSPQPPKPGPQPPNPGPPPPNPGPQPPKPGPNPGPNPAPKPPGPGPQGSQQGNQPGPGPAN